MRYSYSVVYGLPQDLLQAGYGKVAHLPCIFDQRPGYHRIASRYLIDRGLGLWGPRSRGGAIRSRPPSAISIKNFAHWLANFLEWSHIRGVDPLTAEYDQHLIGQYQQEMLKGVWSAANVGLAERTINARVNAAAEFISWASDKGLRKAFVIPKTVRSFVVGGAASSVSHLPIQVEARGSKLREHKRRLGFPQESAIADWLNNIYKKPVVGATEGLICETILETALRETEASCLRVDSFPRHRSDWKVVNPEAALENQAVLVEVRYGTKGPDYGLDHGDKIGPAGIIRVPMPLVLKLHHYREVVRPKALSAAILKGNTLSEQRKIRDDSVHLFINPRTGLRYFGRNVYDIWRSVARPKGWCPHLARDFWACSVLWRRIEGQRRLLESALKTTIDDTVLGGLKSNAESIIQLEIQPQLRHVSKETTMIYLQWLADRLCINLNFHQKWTEELADDNEFFNL